MDDPLDGRVDPVRKWSINVRLDSTQKPRTLLERLIQGARMFKSKPIGWITAATLVCVAGVAIACRLKEGAGQATHANAVVLADMDKKDAPAEPSPLPAESAQAPASEKKADTAPPPLPAATVPPPPSLNAAVTPPEPPKESSVPPAVPAESPPPVLSKEPVTVPTVAPPVPDMKSGSYDIEAIGRRLDGEAPVPKKKAHQKADPTPVTPLVPVAGAETKQDMPSVHLPAPPLPEGDKAKAEVRPAQAPLPESTGIPAVIPSPAKEVAKEIVAPAPVQNKPYWAAQGETLREIARKTLGNGERWRDIEKLNPELRGGTIIPAGTMVRLPSDAQSTGIVPVSGQAEETVATSGVKPLPVIRAKPEDTQGVVAMTGTFTCKMDAQHGMMLPKDVCDAMGKCDTMMLTPGPDRCLWMISEMGARRMLHRIEKAQVEDADVQAFKRIYYSQTEKATVDATGSVKVSEKLAGYAGLTGEVVLIGMDDHFELWDAARWHQYSQRKSSHRSDE